MIMVALSFFCDSRPWFEAFTSWAQEHLAVIAAFDLDWRKNFEPQIAQRYWAAGTRWCPRCPPQNVCFVWVTFWL